MLFCLYLPERNAGKYYFTRCLVPSLSDPFSEFFELLDSIDSLRIYFFVTR